MIERDLIRVAVLGTFYGDTLNMIANWLVRHPQGFQSPGEIVRGGEYGARAIREAISCTTRESLNGGLEISLTAWAGENIRKGNILAANTAPGGKTQLFRVYRVSTDERGMLTAYGQHISYDLNNYPMTMRDCGSWAEYTTHLQMGGAVNIPFGFEITHIPADPTEPVEIPQGVGVREAIQRGLAVYGGEIEWDNLDCKWMDSRGADRGLTVRYGRNLLTGSREESNDGVYTHVYPYYVEKTDDGDFLHDIPESILPVPGTFEFVRIYSLDLSDSFEDVPTTEEIRAKAQEFISRADLGAGALRFTLSYLELAEISDTARDLVQLGDTVHVQLGPESLTESARVTEISFDVLLDRVESITVGTPEKRLDDLIDHVQKVQQIQQVEIESGDWGGGGGGGTAIAVFG